MARYMEVSTQIYSIYMKYVAPEDIVVYSIDEVFMDVTDYLKTYQLKLLEFVQQETGYDRSAIEKMTNDEFAELYDQISDIEIEETPSDDSELSLRGKNAEEFITIVGNTVYINFTLIDDE